METKIDWTDQASLQETTTLKSGVLASRVIRLTLWERVKMLFRGWLWIESLVIFDGPQPTQFKGQIQAVIQKPKTK
jgi:hypothetical protein